MAKTNNKMPRQTRRPLPARSVFPPRRDYSSLSIKDLLDARDAYHLHLSRLKNVVATAVGRYCIHQDDWYAENPPDKQRPKDPAKGPRIRGPRTLANSVIRPWSWPAVLVFVDQWQQPHHLDSEVIPKTLYLPDGRIVPTCVILAERDEGPPPPVLGPFQNSPLLGGGYSCLREHQGETAVGTFACLVKKGGNYYALTNRHVAGGDGEVVRAFIRDGYEPVGSTSNIAVDRREFESIFPEWKGSNVLVTLDAGLVRINDVTDWTSQYFGIGEIDEMYDATAFNLTLDLIGCPVRAFGGISGICEGEIRALFFKYETVGGFEYTTDVLIGPRRTLNKPEDTKPPFTVPGDSGTLWFYDPPPEDLQPNAQDLENVCYVAPRDGQVRRLRPIAMQWGGERLVLPDGTQDAYALGAFLSSICRALDVEVVRNWSLGHDEYWGKIGHFSIGWKACERLVGKLGDLMKANQERIGYPNDVISQGSAFRVDRQKFVPLADVPDYVWVVSSSRPSEAIQHFADIDIQDIKGGPPLIERCVADPKQLAASVWKDYFDGFAQKGVGPAEGALPFRVWQIWEAMVKYLKKKKPDLPRFVAAAGVLAHYVGDASQPLHCSYLHHGVPPMKTVNGRAYPVPHESKEFKEFKKTRPAKIHAIYEQTMLEVDTLKALQLVDSELKKKSPSPPVIKTGHDAAMATIQLMHQSMSALSPKEIIDADDPQLGPKPRSQALWNNTKIREATVKSLAGSVRLLAELWRSAWKVGDGGRVAQSNIKKFGTDELKEIYRNDHHFVPSLSLDEMAKSGKYG